MIPFLDRYAHPFQSKGQSAAQPYLASEIRAVLNAGECTDWIARSIGLGGAATAFQHDRSDTDA